MNLQRILVIVDKEWTQTFRKWSDHSPLWIQPIFATVLLAGVVRCLALSRMHTNATGTSAFGTIIDYLLVFFLVMPMINTSRMAANGTMVDKLSRSLEPLLTTPITANELILGKMFAAVAPNVLMSWMAYVIFACFARAWGFSESYLCGPLLGPVCIGIMLFVVPLMAIMLANVAFWIASRKNDARRANDHAMSIAGCFMAAPLGLVVWLQLQHHLIDRNSLIEIILLLLVVNSALFFLSVKLFRRETILFKWN